MEGEEWIEKEFTARDLSPNDHEREEIKEGDFMMVDDDGLEGRQSFSSSRLGP